MDAGDKVEARGELPREVVDVVDAVSVVKGRSRWQQIMVVVSDWAAEQRRLANVIHNVTKGNPVRPDADREDSR